MRHLYDAINTKITRDSFLAYVAVGEDSSDLHGGVTMHLHKYITSHAQKIYISQRQGANMLGDRGGSRGRGRERGNIAIHTAHV